MITLVAVLDWDLSTIGHPLADSSYHCRSWHFEPGMFRGIAGLDLAPLGIARRVVDGTAASAQARATGNIARPLARMGWHLAQRAGAR